MASCNVPGPVDLRNYWTSGRTQLLTLKVLHSTCSPGSRLQHMDDGVKPGLDWWTGGQVQQGSAQTGDSNRLVWFGLAARFQCSKLESSTWTGHPAPPNQSNCPRPGLIVILHHITSSSHCVGVCIHLLFAFFPGSSAFISSASACRSYTQLCQTRCQPRSQVPCDTQPSFPFQHRHLRSIDVDVDDNPFAIGPHPIDKSLAPLFASHPRSQLHFLLLTSSTLSRHRQVSKAAISQSSPCRSSEPPPPKGITSHPRRAARLPDRDAAAADYLTILPPTKLRPTVCLRMATTTRTIPPHGTCPRRGSSRVAPT